MASVSAEWSFSTLKGIKTVIVEKRLNALTMADVNQDLGYYQLKRKVWWIKYQNTKL